MAEARAPSSHLGATASHTVEALGPRGRATLHAATDVMQRTRKSRTRGGASKLTLSILLDLPHPHPVDARRVELGDAIPEVGAVLVEPLLRVRSLVKNLCLSHIP